MEYIDKEVQKQKRLIELREQLALKDVVDDFEVNRIEKVITEIEELDQFDCSFDADAALLNFQTIRIPAFYAKKKALQERWMDCVESLQKGKKPSKAIRRFVAFVASFLVVASISNYKAIAKWKWLEPIAQWASSFLQLESEIKNPTILSDGTKQYSDFKYVERDYDIELMKLNYLPDGYKLQYITVSENAVGVVMNIQAIYVYDDLSLLYIIEPLGDNQKYWVEKIDLNVEEIKNGGFSFYMYKNDNWYQGTWAYNNLHYLILGEISKNDLREIMQSIE